MEARHGGVESTRERGCWRARGREAAGERQGERRPAIWRSGDVK
jgi:hypothetical protein